MTATIIDHRTPYELAADEWVCQECHRALPESDATIDDWGDPGFCGAWCEFAHGLSGDERMNALAHIGLQGCMRRIGQQNIPHAAAVAACELIDNWFRKQGVETPEW